MTLSQSRKSSVPQEITYSNIGASNSPNLNVPVAILSPEGSCQFW